MLRVLYIGKFCPFHFGHKRTTELAKKMSEELIIAIGSPQSEYFTLKERIEMVVLNTIINPIILEDLKGGHPFYSDWGRFVINQVGNLDVVITGNNQIQQDFLRHEVPILWVPRYNEISGTDIRERIQKHDESWRALVPVESVRIIENSDFYRRYN